MSHIFTCLQVGGFYNLGLQIATVKSQPATAAACSAASGAVFLPLGAGISFAL
jgi:hypothetical protein